MNSNPADSQGDDPHKGAQDDHTSKDLDAPGEPIDKTVRLGVDSVHSMPTIPPADVKPKDDEQFPQRRFGEYELLEILGRGGMGIVYKARQPRLDRTVALKMVIQGQLDSAADMRRFQTEAEAVAKLDHPGIVPVYEVGQRHGRHYFTMAYIEGKSLANLIAARPMAPREAAKMLAKIADAIHHAHVRGILHRDLKPSNVLVDEVNQPRVIDFGLAKRFEEDAALTATGMVVGTPSYMAPERIDERQGEVGPGSDVYALGAVLFEMLSGRPPFQASTPVDTMEQVLKSPPPRLCTLNPHVPAELEAVCRKCLEKNPAKRYATAAELAEDLRRWLDHEPVLAPMRSRLRDRQPSGMVPVFVLGLCVGAAASFFSVFLTETFAPNADGQIFSKSRKSLPAESPAHNVDPTRKRLAEKDERIRQLQADVERLKRQSDQQSDEIDRLNVELADKTDAATRFLEQPRPQTLEDVWMIRNPAAIDLDEAAVAADRLTLEGLQACRGGDIARASEKFQAAIDADERFLPALYYRAYLRFHELRDDKGAIADLDDVLDRLPDDLPSRLLRAEAYMRSGQMDAARTDVNHAASVAPADTAVRIARGKYFSLSGSHDDARFHFEAALENNPDLTEARSEYARHLLRQEDEDLRRQALEHARQAVRPGESDPERRLLLAAAENQFGRLDEAANLAEQVLTGASDETIKRFRPLIDQLLKRMPLGPIDFARE